MSSPIRVLIVDDHAMVAESFRRMLEGHDDIAVVAVVGTVREALEAATRLRPDVVLLDYLLPDGDGVTTAEQIKRDVADTKVVMLTGSSEDERVALRAIEAGCSGFITKNRTADELLAAVRAAHAGDALVAPAMLARLLPRLQRNYRGVAADLTPRELEVLQLMAEGASDKAIAQSLVITLNTARNHVQNVIRKLQAHSKLEAVVTAVREGVLRPL